VRYMHHGLDMEVLAERVCVEKMDGGVGGELTCQLLAVFYYSRRFEIYRLALICGIGTAYRDCYWAQPRRSSRPSWMFVNSLEMEFTEHT
jgi:hypothetical protein